MEILQGATVIMPAAGPFDSYQLGGFLARVIGSGDNGILIVEAEEGEIHAVERERVSIFDESEQ